MKSTNFATVGYSEGLALGLAIDKTKLQIALFVFVFEFNFLVVKENFNRFIQCFKEN